MKFNNLYQTILESLEAYKILSFERVVDDRDNKQYHEAHETYDVEVGDRKFKVVLTIEHIYLKGMEDQSGVAGIKIFDESGKAIYSLTQNDFINKGSWSYSDKKFYKMPKRLAFLQPAIDGIGGVKYHERPNYYKLDQETRNDWQDILPHL